MGTRPNPSNVRLPRHGYALVTITVRDANGFLHHYGDIEAQVGSVHEAIAIMQLQSRAVEDAHRGHASA
ncbi:MAG TPA: hypothetical protein VNT50_09865 [Microbacterium sp.]|uniref:hypothetical protein n=1 Tax=Microbacterium sp. TaxID=51671 RepID=UPI002B6F6B68|nr:hypothetical protein [Microbacterium sp.]HWI31786.1 hypothetical protein [Microbacterium sp.]